ncbi:MAG: hypothetical protein R3C56_08525 [Pirellulaceae bacterium]
MTHDAERRATLSPRRGASSHIELLSERQYERYSSWGCLFDELNSLVLIDPHTHTQPASAG